MEYLRGSEWRRWDLHIHTPFTNKNDQFIGSTKEEKWENFYSDILSYIDAGDENHKVAVLGITDYFSIENYFAVCFVTIFCCLSSEISFLVYILSR